MRSVQKFKKCHASKHTCERHMDVCSDPYGGEDVIRKRPSKMTATVCIIKKKFKRMKWSLFPHNEEY